MSNTYCSSHKRCCAILLIWGHKEPDPQNATDAAVSSRKAKQDTTKALKFSFVDIFCISARPLANRAAHSVECITLYANATYARRVMGHVINYSSWVYSTT